MIFASEETANVINRIKVGQENNELTTSFAIVMVSFGYTIITTKMLTMLSLTYTVHMYGDMAWSGL